VDHPTIVAEHTITSKLNLSRTWLWTISIAAGLFTLIPPSIIGVSSSALAVQSIEHWMSGPADSYAALHIHWFWIPRLLAFLTGDAFSALVIFRALLVAFSSFFFLKTLDRLFDRTRAIIGIVMLLCNVIVLYFLHTFALQLITLAFAAVLLYLFTSARPLHHRIGAVLFGLSLSAGFWPFVLLISVVTVALNLHHRTYTPRSKKTFGLLGLVLLGVASYVTIEIFYFGTAHLWNAINPYTFPVRWTSLIAEGIILALFSSNALLAAIFGRKHGTLGRDFQATLVILGVFFVLNTFSREDMLHDATILVPCLIIMALDRFEKIYRFATIYLVINIGAFLLLPAFRLEPEYAIANARRTKPNDKIAFSYYESQDLLSLGKILDQNSMEEEARQLLSKQRLDSTLVLINPTTDEWLDAATLGAEFPNAKFGWFYGYPINIVRINGLEDTAFIRPPASTPYLSGLFERSFARTSLDSALAPGTPVQESEHFQYIDTRGNDARRRSLIDQLIFLQYEAKHHR